jgi:hypothetical protein
MLRTRVCGNFREIEKIVHSLGKNVVLALDFDGVLAKDKWNSHAMKQVRFCRENSGKLIKDYENLTERLKDLRTEYSNDPLLLTELIEALKGIRCTSALVNYRLKKIYHLLNNFTINQLELTDKSIPEVLRGFNKSGIPFFSVTADYDACALIRPDQLRTLGLSPYFSKPFLVKGVSTPKSPYSLAIDCNTVFTSKVIPCKIPEGTPKGAPCRFHGKNPVSPSVFGKNPGKFYAYFDRNCVNFSKGTVFKHLILDEVIPQKPKHLVFVDDNQKNVEEVGNACLESEIDFHGVLFRSEQEFPQK